MDFIGPIKESITAVEGQASQLGVCAHLDDPFATTENIPTHYPEANAQLIDAQDMRHLLLLLCQRHHQKRVPFVPTLDKNLEFWFKKDSFWKSKDLETVGQRVGRICIVRGLIYAKCFTIVNQPIKGILHRNGNGHIVALITDVYGGGGSGIPVKYFGSGAITALDDVGRVERLIVAGQGGNTTFTLPASASQGALPNADSWLGMLAGETSTRSHALFPSDVFVQRSKLRDNQMRHIFAPAYGMVAGITNPRYRAKTALTVKEKTTPVVAVSRLPRLGCQMRKRFSLASLRSVPYGGACDLATQVPLSPRDGLCVYPRGKRRRER